jgi:acetolactate synthase-1/2/3 large subunit
MYILIMYKLTGSDVIFNALKNRKIKSVFCYSGGAIMHLIDKFRNNKTGAMTIPYYINNHEQNTGHSACGYTKSLNGKLPGICISTSGPGLTNLITPMTDACHDGIPLIVISGQVPIKAIGTNAFQECNAVELTKPITKKSYQVKEGDDIESIMNEAFRISVCDKPGVVHIDVPKCRLAGLNGENKVCFDPNNLGPNNINYEFLMHIIEKSERPIIIGGKGVNCFTQQLKEFVELLQIPITTTLHAVGCYDETLPLSLKFHGMHGNPAGNYAVQSADCIINLGGRFDDRTIGTIDTYAPKCKNIIHVNIEITELNKIFTSSEQRVVHSVHSCCGNFFDNILPLIRKKYYRNDWLSQINVWKTRYAITYNMPDNNKINTQMAIKAINNYILYYSYDFPYICTGVGNHQMMAAQFIEWKYPRMITSGSLGVMGAGLPFAIGSQIANPSRTVVLIDGDGSFNHTSADLQTVVRYNLPIKMFIMNDKCMSMVHAWETLFFDKNYVATACDHNPDYVKLASSYGIHAVYCDNSEELARTVSYVMNYKGPILCDMRVVSDLCLPLVAPGKALDKMILLNTGADMNFDKNSMAPS